MRMRTGLVLICLLVVASASATYAAEGPQASAATTRDARGVWFVTGSTLAELYDGMGYAVATDRLWQCELYYRSATGRLSELLGPSQLETDMFMSTIGYTPKELQKGFKALSADGQTMVTSFITGYNRRVDEVRANPTLVPFEFVALSAQMHATVLPSKWTESDVLAWLALLQREFDPEALEQGQLVNAYLAQALQAQYGQQGLAMFQDLRWINDPEALTYIPPSGNAPEQSPEDPSAALSRLEKHLATLPDLKKAAKDVSSTLDDVINNLKRINAWAPMGSYAWTVSGTKTASGHPILYSGPQMGFTVPSIVTKGSLRGGGLDISGMTVPGIPGIIIGRTPHHAWSMQVGHAHTLDYYVESPLSVKKHHKVVIHVAGGDDVTFWAYRTSRGPVINPMPLDLKNLTGTIVVWAYAHWGYEFQAVQAFLDLARAQSVAQFGAGIEEVAVSQHFCYADRDGNIAYWMSGRDPVRRATADYDPRLPLAGDNKHDWPKPVSLKPRSHAENPSQGYFGGWNNKSNAGYMNAPQNLGYSFGPFARAHVVDDYLKTHNGLTFEQVRDLALNIATTDSSFGPRGGVPWSKVGSYFTAAVQAYPNANRLAFLGMVQAWDGHFVAGGPTQWALGPTKADGYVIEDTWIKNMLTLTFAPKLGPENAVPDVQFLNVLIHALEGTSAGVPVLYNWWQDPSHSGLPTDPQQLIVLALDMTMQQLGAPPYNQPRGVISYRHDLLGLLPVATPYSDRSTYAQCVELGPTGPVRIESMFPLGESGFIGTSAQGAPVFDPNFFSMTPVFDPFTPRPFPLFE